MSAVSLRFANIYGPGSTHKRSVIAEFCKSALRGEPLTIFGDGSQTRDFLYIDDLLDAVQGCLSRPNMSGVFQLGRGFGVSVLDVAGVLQELRERNGGAAPPPDFRPARAFEVHDCYYRIDKARDAFGFQSIGRISRGGATDVDVVSEERDRTRSRHRVLGIIPARGGSKRIPRKNLYSLAGKPLIAYAIEAASDSDLLARTIVSTDDEEIRRAAEAFGGDAPFLRPQELAGDDSPSVDFVAHALGALSRSGERDFDYVCIVEPTAPLRTADDIDAALSLLVNEGTDSVIGLTPVEYGSPSRLRVVRQRRVQLWAPDLRREGKRQRDVEQRTGLVAVCSRAAALSSCSSVRLSVAHSAAMCCRQSVGLTWTRTSISPSLSS